MTLDPAPRTFTVADTQAGQRLDRFLVEALPDLSRAGVRELLNGGQVRVNGRRPRKGDPLSAGAVVTVDGELPAWDFTPVADATVTLTVRWEGVTAAVVDKPAGVATHPLRPDETGTLANGVLARWPETADVGFHRREPGLLHRLDTDTSGLVLIARTVEAFATLRTGAKEGRVHKRYLALVEGRVTSEGAVDLPLVPHRKDPRRVEAVTAHVRLRAGTKTHPAHTRYRVARALGDFTLLEVELETAFRHQVRAHLAAIGHPLVGDALYRGPLPPEGIQLTRHFLHASELAFADPATGVEVRVTSPLPDELTAVVSALRAG